MTTLADLLAAFTAAAIGGGQAFKPQALTAFRHAAGVHGWTIDTTPVRGLLVDDQDGTAICEALRTSLLAAGKPRATVNNYCNCLRRFIRWAAGEGWPLCAAPEGPRSLPAPRGYRRVPVPRRPAIVKLRELSYHYPPHQWPDDPRTLFEEFTAWTTAPMAAGRSPRHFHRPATAATYAARIAVYLGYLRNIAKVLTPETFTRARLVELLQDEAQLLAFINWYTERVRDAHDRPKYFPTELRSILIVARVIVQHYLPTAGWTIAPADVVAARLLRSLPSAKHAGLKSQIAATLPTIADMIRVADATDAEADRPIPPIWSASLRRTALLIRLMCFVPLRRRNWTEARLGDHIYRDDAGGWHLRFASDDVKNARTLTFDLDSYLWPYLDRWIADQGPRARLLATKTRGPANAALNLDPRLMFPGCGGAQASGGLVWRDITRSSHAVLGVRVHPHLMRDIVATSILADDPRELLTVAHLLGDTVEMVLKHYSHVTEGHSAARAARLIRTQIGLEHGAARPAPTLSRDQLAAVADVLDLTADQRARLAGLLAPSPGSTDARPAPAPARRPAG